MNYATIKYCDIANGPGVRTSLFVSGCTHRCKGCFNEIAWDFDYGEPFTKKVSYAIMDSLRPSYIKGLSLLGGEPMEPENQRGLLSLLKMVRAVYPDKTVWCYSGYTYEEITAGRAHCEVTDEVLACIDVLVDGRFEESLKDITLQFRGSSNQRIIDIAATKAAGEIIWWQDDPLFATHTFE